MVPAASVGYSGTETQPASQIAKSLIIQCAVFFDNQRHLVAGLQAQALQVRRHAAALVHHLAPGVVAHRAAAQRLRQRHPVGCGLFPVIQALQRELVGGDFGGHDEGARWGRQFRRAC